MFRKCAFLCRVVVCSGGFMEIFMTETEAAALSHLCVVLYSISVHNFICSMYVQLALFKDPGLEPFPASLNLWRDSLFLTFYLNFNCNLYAWFCLFHAVVKFPN